MTGPVNVLPPGSESARADAFLQSLLERVGEENRVSRALIRLTPDQARSDLSRVLAARNAGTPTLLDGTAFVVKDNIDIAGIPGTLGSRHFADRIPDRDARVVKSIRAAGGVLLGTANMHELAFGATSENPHFGTIRNPWAIDRNAGGSSGGSAVAVAQDWVAASLGSDTGGSVRCPAAIAGVTGLRPTSGTLSSEGLYPLAPSFDTVGFFARDTVGVERLLTVTRSAPLDVSPPRALRIGIPTNPYFTGQVDQSVAEAVATAADVLERSGARLIDVEVPDPTLADQVARLLVRAEAWAVHGPEMESDPEHYGRDVVDRLYLGKVITPDELKGLRERRRDLAHRIDELWTDIDVILLPTVPRAPQKLFGHDPLQATEQNLAFTYLWGLGGLPALSVPGGFDAEGLPVGVQLVARRDGDGLLCAVGKQFQTLTDWHTYRPSRNGRTT